MKNFKKYILFIITVLVIILVNSCRFNTGQVPVVNTMLVSKITEYSIEAGGNIESDGGANVFDRGICYSSTNQTPTINDNKIKDREKGIGFFKIFDHALTQNTTYYYRAYATNNNGTGYGNVFTFTTKEFVWEKIKKIVYDNKHNVKDIDGNVYHTANIGKQTWMVENLKVTHYRNGDAIPNVTNDKEWGNTISGKYCNYGNEGTDSIFGRLYNWDAVSDKRNIAPKGWHVATNADWIELIDYYGGQWEAAAELQKLIIVDGNIFFSKRRKKEPNKNAFSALNAGMRNEDGSFEGFNNNGHWWTSSEYNIDLAYHINIYLDGNAISRGYFNKFAGCSVRCVKN
jgi:uncharacterized protein (TIGR02145 family)